MWVRPPLGALEETHLFSNVNWKNLTSGAYCHYPNAVHKKALSLRLLLNSGVLLLGAVLAHAIACGTFISLVPFFLLSVLIITLLSLLSIREIEGLHLAFLIILCQVSAHFLLGNGQMRMQIPVCGGSSHYMTMAMKSMMGPTMMIATHSIVGIFSYFFIMKSETFWNFAGFFLLSVFVPSLSVKPTHGAQLLTQKRLELTTFITRLQSYLTEATTRLSAPPSLAATI